MTSESLVERIDYELLRLKASSLGGEEPGWKASPEGEGMVVMGHPTKMFEIALYDGATLLDALRIVETSDGLAGIRGALTSALRD